jgi:hypothetical protein
MAWPSLLSRTKDWGTEILTDADLEGQYDVIINYVNDFLHASTGHKHDGTTAEGPKVLVSNLTLTDGVSGDYVLHNGTNLVRAESTSSVQFLIDGSGSAIETGIKGDIRIPFAGTITGAYLLADQTGSIVIDLWKDTTANFPPTVADTITASAKPTISSALKAEDTTLTGWTTTVSAGDIIRVNVDSCTIIQRCLVVLNFKRTA